MAANTAPISPASPTLSAYAAAATLAANTAMDGTGTAQQIMLAGVNGSRVNRLQVVHKGSNVATVMRIFMNNGLTNATAANNTLVAEATIPLNTLSQVAASLPIAIPLNMVVPSGYKLNYTLGTTVLAGHSVTAVDAGDY